MSRAPDPGSALHNPPVLISRTTTVRGAVGLANGLAVLGVVATAVSIALYAYNARHVDTSISYLFGDAAAGLLYPLLGAFLPDKIEATSVARINS